MNLKEYNICLSNTRFETLEEALETMMEDKRMNPLGICCLSPYDNAKSEEWDNAGYDVYSYPSYTNAPVLGSTDDNYDLSKEAQKLLEMVADEKKFVSALADRICKEYDVERNAGWSLCELSLDDEYEIYLFIEPSHWKTVEEKVLEFNDKISKDGFPRLLTLDEKLWMVGGKCSLNIVRGGFFEKRRIRKQNKKFKKDLSDFLDSLHGYMRKV